MTKTAKTPRNTPTPDHSNKRFIEDRLQPVMKPFANPKKKTVPGDTHTLPGTPTTLEQARKRDTIANANKKALGK